MRPPEVRQAAAQAQMLAPGVAIAVLVAAAAQFLSDHYGAPAMLMALLLGMALSFVADEGRTAPGVAFTARTVLRFGVGLLGARMSVELLRDLGPGVIALVAGAVVVSIALGMAASRISGQGWAFGLLTAGAVSICGASAAMAIAAILPRGAFAERNLTFTVLGVTVLSTLAMIVYPVAAVWLGLPDRAAGVFLGGTIHDVAQVVGAGYSISPEAGDTATLVKLIRVSMLAPVIVVAALALRILAGAAPAEGGRPPLLPGFVAAFIMLAAANSAGLVPAPVQVAAGEVARWALLAAIAAVGMKTELRRVMTVGGAAVALLVGQTLVIAALILAGLGLVV